MPPQHTVEPLTHPKYRADIDGLRAVAVLSVVIFHAFPHGLKGGFIGVDIFFVISGFLISTIIFSSLERDSFSFVEFYSRRIKRIFPALLLVLVASYAFGWFVLLADEYQQLGKHIAGGAGFIANFMFWNESGYFDNAAETKPLLHLWSLGIEEQFYIVWPLLLWFVWKQGLNLLTVTLTVMMISFTLNIGKVHHDTIAAFYSPQTRFWELLLGSVLAYMTLYKQNTFSQFRQKLDVCLSPIIYAQAPKEKGTALRNVQALLGAGLIIIGVLVISKEKHFPGGWAVLPTVGAALIISANTNAWLNRSVLSNPVLVWFGLISFPLYLWHWPLLSFAHIMENGVPSKGIRIAAILIAIGLAWLTYKLLEKPIRNGKHSKAKTIILFSLMLVVGFVGYNDYKQQGFESRVRDFEKMTKANMEWEFPGNLKPYPYKDMIFNYGKSDIAKTTLFIGDSNIEQYYSRIDELIKTHPSSTNSVIFSTVNGCLPIPKTGPEISPHCFDLLEKSLDLALSKDEISTVVIGGLWFYYLTNDWSSLKVKGQYYFDDQGQKLPIEQGSIGYHKALSELSNYIEILKKNKKQVFLVLNIPIGQALDPKFLAQRSINNFPKLLTVRDGGISLKTLDEKYGLIRNDLIAIANKNQIDIIDPIKYLCKNSYCQSVDMNGNPMYRDFLHLRPEFVRYKATFIDATISN